MFFCGRMASESLHEQLAVLFIGRGDGCLLGLGHDIDPAFCSGVRYERRPAIYGGCESQPEIGPTCAGGRVVASDE